MSRFGWGTMVHGYLRFINHSSATISRSTALLLQNRCPSPTDSQCVKVFITCPARWGGQLQGWALQASAQEHRAPTVGPALRPTSTGPAVQAPAPAFIANRQGNPPLHPSLPLPTKTVTPECFSCSDLEQLVEIGYSLRARPSYLASPPSHPDTCDRRRAGGSTMRWR